MLLLAMGAGDGPGCACGGIASGSASDRDVRRTLAAGTSVAPALPSSELGRPEGVHPRPEPRDSRLLMRSPSAAALVLSTGALAIFL